MQDNSPNVAILIDTATSWGRRLIRGITNYAQTHGPWHLIVTAQGINEPLHTPAGWSGDGIIARISDQAMAEELLKMDVPIVNVSSINVEGFDFPRIHIDYQATGAMAVEHLRDCRYRQFGYVGPLSTACCRRHAEAYWDEVKAAGGADDGFEFDLRSLSNRSQDWLEQRKRLGAWLSSLPKPIGIYTWGTEPGQEVLDACREMGIAVPVEIGLLADDDDPLLCNTTTPSMSAVLHASERIGYLAAERLGELISGESPSAPEQVVSPVQVTCRASTETMAVEDRELMLAVAYMRRAAYEPLTVDEIADAVPMTRRALERKFRKNFDRTPMEQVRLMRLARARDLLANTDIPISSVAYQSGFSSGEYLAKTFDRYYQISPLNYRKRFR